MGKIIIVSGPFGSGKNTIIDYILATHPHVFTKTITATTRTPRPAEIDGIDKYFMSLAEFDKLKSENGFIETEEVNKGVWYGTPYFSLEKVISSDKYGIMDIDVVGAMNLKEKLGDQVVLIFIRTSNLEQQEKRLRDRNTETEEIIQDRLKRRDFELSFEHKYEIVIVNDILEQTKLKIDTLVENIQQSKSIKL